MYTEHTNELQLKDLQVAGGRRSPFGWAHSVCVFISISVDIGISVVA
jgi:hypothetical protein